MTERIWNGTVVREVKEQWHTDHNKQPMKGVVISQTDRADKVIVRWEGGAKGEWEESIYDLIPLDEKPIQDGTRAYSGN